MGRFKLVAVLLAVLVTAAGCYSDPVPVTRAPTAAPSSASPPPSPPPPVSVADLTSWVEHARLTPDVVGAPERAVERSGTEPYTAPCKTAIVANSYLVYSHYAYWIGTRIDNVVHDLFAFSALYGKEAVGQAHKVVTDCSEYELTGPGSGNSTTPTVVHLKVVPDLPLPLPAGTDAAYAYCEISTNVTPGHGREVPANLCTALVSRRNVMMSVRVEDGVGAGMDDARRKLASVLAVAVAALVKAVPSG